MDNLSPGSVFGFYQIGAHNSRFGIYQNLTPDPPAENHQQI
jgi:hypothetical protein